MIIAENSVKQANRKKIAKEKALACVDIIVTGTTLEKEKNLKQALSDIVQTVGR